MKDKNNMLWLWILIALVVSSFVTYNYFPQTMTETVEKEVTKVIKEPISYQGTSYDLEAIRDTLNNLSATRLSNEDKDRTILMLREASDDLDEVFRALFDEIIDEAEDDPERVCEDIRYDRDEVKVDDWDIEDVEFVDWNSYDEFTVLISDVELEYDRNKCSRTLDLEAEYDNGRWDITWD